jgi:hypothetical protein
MNVAGDASPADGNGPFNEAHRLYNAFMYSFSPFSKSQSETTLPAFFFSRSLSLSLSFSAYWEIYSTTIFDKRIRAHFMACDIS